MSEAEVILAIEPRLLREFLQRAIAKAPGLRVVAAPNGLRGLPALPETSQPRWLVVSLRADGRLPAPVDVLLSGQPALCVVGVADDGGLARIRRAGAPDIEMPRLSLPDLVAVLHSRGKPAVRHVRGSITN